MSAQHLHIDQQILTRIAEGDHAAFTLLYKKYWPLLYLHVYRMLRDEELAQDVVQETFTWFWQHAPLITFRSSISSYLYSAVRHNVFNLIRREKVRSVYLKEIAAFVQSGHYQVDEAVRFNELVGEIESEIDRMPPRMREIFNLSRKDMLSHKQIAELLNISESTVREQIKRALHQLRAAVKDRPYFILVAASFLR